MRAATLVGPESFTPFVRSSSSRIGAPGAIACSMESTGGSGS